MSAPTLRPYQREALAATRLALEQGQNRILIKKPTGTGKTVMFAAMLGFLGDWLEQQPHKGAKMLVIAHREELLDQAAEKIRRQNPGLMVDIEQGDRHANRYSDVVIASIQSLAAMKFRRLLRLLQYHSFNLVIVDEAHHAAAATYRTALAHMRFLPMADVSESGDIEAATHDDVVVMEKALEGWDQQAPKDRLLVGVTATPNRSDAIGLGCVFQTIAYSYGLKEAIDDGWLVNIKPWVVETSDNLDAVRSSHGDFNQRDLADTVNNPKRNRLAVDAWKLYAEGESTIAFTVDVQHAHDLAAVFRADGIVAHALSGETPKEERRQMLAGFARGEVKVICNCMVLTEGTDLPIASCILHGKPTKSPTLYEQMTGRGLRPLPGDPVGPERIAAQLAGATFKKNECIVIDVVDIARRHSLQAAPVLYGLPPGVKTKGEDLKKLQEQLEELRGKFAGFDVDEELKKRRYTIQELLDRASTFDIWSVPSLGAFGAGRACSWIKTATDVYRLQYPWGDGLEVLQVSKDLLGHFEVICTLTPRDGGQKRQRTLAAAIPSSEAAADLAEAFVLQERRSVMKVAGKDEPWKQRPATAKQVALLGRLRVPGDHRKITAGRASELIDMAMMRKGRA